MTASAPPTDIASLKVTRSSCLIIQERRHSGAARRARSRPKIDTTIGPGDASLGIQSRPNGSNDGVLIQSMLPGSAARQSQLRVGDVIVSIDGEPTRALAELQAIIGSKRVGDRVRVRARRDGAYLTVVVTLRPLRW